ncbi:hypothetical protein [Yinghuangia seranimata]|uniref:hypothetical protein n=1 Tax=Yinghuangia seranimata TaxID=408067 RepID=UPI00248BFB58|nr:hypothetical protein [Yinghuangia seranimata]MDI2126408.1 hypothetical protein [Yinghuangia seranimata]
MAQARPIRPTTGRAGRVNRPTVALILLVVLLTSVIAYGATRSRGGTPHTPGQGAQPGVPSATQPGDATPAVPGTDTGITPAQLDALAAARTHALAAGDEAAFTAALDPATPGLVDEQRRLFRNLRPIPFDEAAYRVDSSRPVPGAAGTLIVDVSFDHRITNADVATVGEGYRWTVTRPAPGAPLRISSITGTPYEGAGYRYARDYPAPWDRATLTVVRRPHTVVLADPQVADRAESLADAAEQAAVTDLTGYAGPRGTSPGFVLVPVADRAAFYELYGGRADQHGDESGLTYALRTSPTGTTATQSAPGSTPQFGGARIVVDVTSGYFTSGDPERAAVLLRHETAHALITPLRSELAGQNQPVWLVEGFADWLALRPHHGHLEGDLAEARTYVRSGRFPGTLPTDADLYQADPVGNAASYELAHLVLLRIEQTRGSAAVYRLVSAVYADPSPASVDRAIKDATGRGRADFERDWAQYVNSMFGR